MNDVDILLVDGKNYGFKHAYAHISLRNSDGVPSGMFHGGLSGLLALHKKFPNAAIVFCWDCAGKTWRHVLAPGLYKSNRTKPGDMKPEVRAAFSQFSEFSVVLHKILKFKHLQFEGVEADDLIGLCATAFSHTKKTVLIVSSDKDFYQLLDDHVSVYAKDTLYTPHKVFVEYGVKTKDWLAYRALTGDASDNLPGAPGFGPVKAKKALELGLRPDLAYEHQGHVVKELYGSKLMQDWNMVRYCWKLSRIARHLGDLEDYLPGTVRLEIAEKIDSVIKNPYREGFGTGEYKRLLQFLGQYELKQLLTDRQVWWKIK